MVSSLSAVLVLGLAGVLGALVLVMILASGANSPPAVAAQLRNLALLAGAGVATGLIGVGVSLVLGRVPLAMTFAVGALLVEVITALAWWEFGRSPLPPDYQLRVGKLVLRTIVMLVFGGGAMVMFYVGAREWRYQKLLLSGAEPIEVEIVRSEVSVHHSRDTDRRPLRDNSTTSYRPELAFRYVLDGREYESDLIRPSVIGRDFASRSAAEEEIAPFPLGARVQGWVSRQVPERGYLIREASGGPAVFLVVGSLVPIVVQLISRFL